MNLLAHLHPATVHFPIALLFVASGAGLAYLFWRPLPLLRLLTWATMAIGWPTGGVAVLTGLLAQSGLPPQAPYRGVLNWHIGAGLAVLLVYGALLYLYWLHMRRAVRPLPPSRRAKDGAAPAPVGDLLDDRSRRWLLAGLLLLGALLLLATGWNGGQLVYVWGVNVAR